MRPPPPSWAQGCWHSAEDRAAANSQQLPRASISLITLKGEGCQHSPPPWLPPTALGSPMVEDTLPLTPAYWSWAVPPEHMLYSLELSAALQPQETTALGTKKHWEKCPR